MAIPSLDGMRAVSIGLVFLGHVGFDITPGGFGVTVFFVLSGYLITTLLRIEYGRDQSVSLKQFYLRRAFRIWPAFYAVLLLTALATLIVGLGTGHVDRLPILSQVAHFYNYFQVFYKGPQQAMLGTGIFWSLAVEEHFYLVLPLLFITMNRLRLSLRRQAVVLCAMAAGVLVWRCVLVFHFHVPQPRTYLSTDTRADSLLLGCALALAANPMIDEVRQSAKAIRNGAILGVVAILGSLAYRNPEFREGFRYTIQSVALLLILRYVVLAPGSTSGRVLNARVVVWLGKLSYPFYLIHLVVILELYKHLQGRVLVGAIALIISIALSWALQKAVMDPASRLRHRLFDKRTVEQSPTPIPS